MDTTKQTIAEFLLARIAEDEEVARAASHQKVAGPFHGNWHADSALLRANGALDRADRAHIARHDPARVLAECKAKRRIVELHREWVADDSVRDPYWSALVDALASVYNDHPDWREEWRP